MRTRHNDIVEYWDRADRGMFRPVKIRRRVSYQTNLLVHEFGHQVDGELLALGFEAAEHVYGELSVALFRIPRPHVRQWNRHLLNWTGNSSWLLAGPGDTPAHAVARRDTTLPLLRKQIGSWKVQNRDEVFAEAFALSFTSADPDLRQRLAGFRTALADVGLMCRRRPGPA